MSRLPALALAALPIAWLVPNHYYPWAAAWGDGWAIALLGLALLFRRTSVRITRPWLLFCALSLAAVVLQTASGHIFFTGDAWLVGLYLACLAGAMSLGSSLGMVDRHAANPAGHGALAAWHVGMVAAAVLSVGLGLAQWTGAVSLGIWGVDLPPGERPTANIAQTNHLATLCFLALCSLGYLQQRRIVGLGGFLPAAAWLLLGMAMTSSRTGWLQIAFLIGAGLLLMRRCDVQLPRWTFGALAAFFVVVQLSWPAISDALLLSPGRTADQLAQGGTRTAHWSAMLHALSLRPVLGYGWQQASVAQLQVAADRPFVGEFIEHSHNIALDLLVWNGIPLGVLLCGLVIGWYVKVFWRCRSGSTWWMLVALTGLLIHSMLEYPLEFAYFLIPFGLLVGAVQPRAEGTATPRQRWQSPVFGALLLAAVGWTGAEYLRAEEAYRRIRMEAARIGLGETKTPLPELVLLTQLGALQKFIQTEAHPGMAPNELDWMRQVSTRFAYPPALFRYALAAGLNGQPAQASRALASLCRIHPAARCNEAREAWSALQQREPLLVAIPAP